MDFHGSKLAYGNLVVTYFTSTCSWCLCTVQRQATPRSSSRPRHCPRLVNFGRGCSRGERPPLGSQTASLEAWNSWAVKATLFPPRRPHAQRLTLTSAALATHVRNTMGCFDKDRMEDERCQFWRIDAPSKASRARRRRRSVCSAPPPYARPWHTRGAETAAAGAVLVMNSEPRWGKHPRSHRSCGPHRRAIGVPPSWCVPIRTDP